MPKKSGPQSKPSGATDWPDNVVVDNIHGDLHFSDQELEIVNTATFQRLRKLKQIQMGHLVYPNATHTRFAHSLGVFGIMAKITDAAQERGQLKLHKTERDNLRLSALLHDIGHYPYSHLLELLDKVKLTEEFLSTKPKRSILDRSREPYPDHEELGRLIITRQRDILEKIGGAKRATEIGQFFSRTRAKESQLTRLIHSTFDMDRVDYLMRDARAAGVPYGEIDLNYLLNNIRISPEGMVGVEEKALASAEHFLMARFFMYRAVYYHKTTYGFEMMCKHLLARARDKGGLNVPTDGTAIRNIALNKTLLAEFTDSFVDKIIQDVAALPTPSVMRDLAVCILSRRPARLLAQACVLSAEADGAAEKMLFHERCRSSIQEMMKRFNRKPGHFLICSVPPIELEKRGPLVTAEKAQKLPSDAEDELIKVFLDKGGPEPVSMVDVRHSIMSRLAPYRFEMFRLYAVPSPNTTADELDDMEKYANGVFKHK